MVKDIEAGRAISSSRRNRPDAPLCHGVLHLGCGAYAAVSSQRRPLLGLMHRVHSFLCAHFYPPVASITRLTASNDTGACEIYETARTDFAHLCAIRHFSSLYSLLPLYPAIGLFCIPSCRLSNLLFSVRICWEIFFGSDENARSSFSFPPLLFETIKISRIESLMEDRRVFFSSSFPFFSFSYFASFRSCGRNGH